MLDLGALEKDCYKIKLADKTILKIKKPKQVIFATMLDMVNSDMDDMETMDALYELMTRIFNRNTNGREFSKEEIEDMMDVPTSMLVLKDYLQDSLEKVGESKSRTSQPMAKAVQSRI